MASSSLKELFVGQNSLAEADAEQVDERLICLHFKYGSKNYFTNINDVKEIIDYPLSIPFPMDAGPYMGLFNLRGTIIPIIDPDKYFMNISEKHRFKAKDVFKNMKLRLIVFEIEDEGLMALPVSEIGKTEIPTAEMKGANEYARVNNIPHERFDMKFLIRDLT